MTEQITINLSENTIIQIDRFISVSDQKPIYRLTWGTGFLGVYDEFTEYYQSLALALARTATLEYAVSNQGYYKHEPLRFSTNASRFLEEETNL